MDDDAVQTELRVALTSAIDDLPPDYCAALLLCDVEDLSHLQIADVLGVDASSARIVSSWLLSRLVP